jgi:hypothetical protein
MMSSAAIFVFERDSEALIISPHCTNQIVKVVLQPRLTAVPSAWGCIAVTKWLMEAAILQIFDQVFDNRRTHFISLRPPCILLRF